MRVDGGGLDYHVAAALRRMAVLGPVHLAIDDSEHWTLNTDTGNEW